MESSFTNYCISLDAHAHFFKKLKDDCLKVMINIERVQGVIATEEFAGSLISPNPIAYSSLSQLGCLVAHLNAIKKFYEETTTDYCLILEDDAWLSPLLCRSNLDPLISMAPKGWEVLQLSTSSKRVTEYLLKCLSKYKLKWHNWTYGNWGNFAYIISRRGACKIISLYYENGRFTLASNWAPDNQVSDFLIYHRLASYTSTYPLIGFRSLDTSYPRITDNPNVRKSLKLDAKNGIMSEEDYKAIWSRTITK